MIKYFNYIILFLGLTIGTSSAQEMLISSRLDTNLIVIGDQTRLTVAVQYPNDVEVVFPLMLDTVVSEIEILDLTFDTILTQQNINHYLINYTITSFDSGYYVIPSQLIINTKTGDTLKSRALPFAVATLVLDSAQQNQIFDIKAPIDAPWTLSEFLSENYPYLLLGLLLIALIFAVLWYLRKRKNKVLVPLKKIVPKEAAHIIALRDLDSLKDKKLWQNDRIKLYYVELSEIIRNYIENRYTVPALEQTSSEIFESLSHSNMLTAEQLIQLKQVLSTADMAKFAKAKPLANENDLALQNAYNLIEKTKLAELIIEATKEKLQVNTSQEPISTEEEKDA